MSLPNKAIDRLFERMAATYTTAWVRQFEGVPMQNVKTAWSHELAPFSARLDAIAWALENLPGKCPNVIEFKNLCRQAPRPPEPALPMPAANPERMREELAKLGHIEKAKRMSASTFDHKDWAKRLIAQHEAGYKVRPISLRFAREALRMHLHGAEAGRA